MVEAGRGGGNLKAWWRREMRARRRELEGREARQAQIVGHLVTWLAEFFRARAGEAGVLGLYAGKASEADPRGLAAFYPGAVAWPKVVGEGLVFAKAAPEALRPGYRGLDEPPEGAEIVTGGLAVVLVPALAVDMAGGRLGQGGGYYDRFLSQLAPEVLKVGVVFEAQVVDALPREPHDIAMDAYVTEAGVFELTALTP